MQGPQSVTRCLWPQESLGSSKYSLHLCVEPMHCCTGAGPCQHPPVPGLKQALTCKIHDQQQVLAGRQHLLRKKSQAGCLSGELYRFPGSLHVALPSAQDPWSPDGSLITALLDIFDLEEIGLMSPEAWRLN